MSDLKITYIGGGSQQWALNLMADLALSPKLSGELVLHDIDGEAARKNMAIAEDIFGRDQAVGKFKVSVEDDLHKSLEGCDFVVISIEPGPIESRFVDLKIPEKYGIYQTVGDTTGPGGIARAMRSIPTMAGFAHAIMEVCPDAWVINYTNPMAWCTAALYAAEPEIKAVGCCHEIFNTQEIIAKYVAEKYDVELPDRQEIELEISGVNHFTFASSARWKGKELLPELLEANAEVDNEALLKNALERIEKEEWFDSDAAVAFNFLRDFGALGAAGDRHLAEFVPWYLANKDEINNWGVVLTPYEWRVKRTETQDKAREEFLASPLKPSGEEGVMIIEALSGKGNYRTNVNMPNIGQNPDAKMGAIVENYCNLSKNRMEPVLCGEMPVAIQSLIDRNIDIQMMVTEGVMEKDKEKVFAAFKLDPLVNIGETQARKLFEEIIEAQGF